MAEVENIITTNTNLNKSERLDPLANLLHSFLGNLGIPKLSDEELTLCEGKLTASKCYNLTIFSEKKITRKQQSYS